MITALLIAQAVVVPAVPQSPPAPVETGWVIQALALQPADADPKPRKAYEQLGIVQQQVLPLGAAGLMVRYEDRKAFRARTGIDPQESWRAAEWVTLSSEPGRRFAHRGWLFCREEANRRVRFPQCLRDADADGRFEQMATVSDGSLAFTPIDPIAFRFGPADHRTNATNYQGVQITYERFGDGIDFYAQPVGSPGARITRTVPIARAAVPAPVRILGAELTVRSWDRERPVMTVEKTMATAPLRMVRAPVPGDPARIGLHAELVEVPPPPGRLDRWTELPR